MRHAALLFGLMVAGPALGADDINSAYTDLDTAQCTIMESDDFGTVWACPGYRGYPVRVAEGDLRFFVSYGFGAAGEPAAEQTPPPFNYLGAKIEWRLSDRSGDWRPFATIVRYFIDKGDTSGKEGQVLVVTRIAPGATCQIAYVDATANPDANELARKAADDFGDASCPETPQIVGEFAAWDR